MQRVLIANIFGIGDVLFTTPMISNLKRDTRGVSVDYLCNARTRPLLDLVPGVDRVMVYEKDEILRKWACSRTDALKNVWTLFSKVRARGYDHVFDLTLSRQMGFFFMLAGIKDRTGLDYHGRGLFLTKKLSLPGFEKKHVIEYYLDLLREQGLEVNDRRIRLIPRKDGVRKAGEMMAKTGGAGTGRVALIPGGGGSWGWQAGRKRWPPERFAAAADILSREGFSVALLGDRTESAICEKISRLMEETPSLVENSLPLKEYISLLSCFDLVLCNDGGPLHIAVGLGLRTVSLFGPVSEKVYGPYPPSDEHRVITSGNVPCRPCYGRFKLPDCDRGNECLTGIEPERVAEACLEVLER